jgi:uncharacterized protein YigE (DUF2233 family)
VLSFRLLVIPLIVALLFAPKLNSAFAEPREIPEPTAPTAPTAPTNPGAPAEPTSPAPAVAPAAEPTLEPSAPSSPVVDPAPVHQEEPAISPAPAEPIAPTPVIAPEPIAKPVVRAPVKPVAKPAVKKPAVKKPVVKKPVTKKPLIKKPAAKPLAKPVANPAVKPKTSTIKPRVTLKRSFLRLGVTPTSRPGPLPAPTTSITLETRRVAGITVRVIRVNLGDPRVKLKVISPMAGIGRGGAAFNTLVNGSNAVAVINGGYFHPRTFSIAGDLVVNGKHISTGRLRSVFAITPDNRVVIRTHSSIAPAAWAGYETALAGGPFVLQKGNVVVAPRREGYRDPSVWSKAPRSAVGVVNNRQFFFISTTARLNLFDLAKVMDALGAKDAIALDGGSSVGMAFRREVLIRPGRRIAYGLGVFVEPKPIKRGKV